MFDDMHKDSGCLKCPVNEFECDAQYRGSRCAALRAKVGVYFDPKTNADRIQTIQQLAKLLTRATADGCPPDMDWDCAKSEYGWDACDACWERWLQQPAEEETT